MSVVSSSRKATVCCSCRRGFTLLEIIIALAIFSGGVLGLFGALSLSGHASLRAYRVDRVTEIAENELAEAVIAAPDSLSPATGTVDQFSWNRNYTNKSEGLVLAMVTVTWNDEGRAQTFELSQLFLPRKK